MKVLTLDTCARDALFHSWRDNEDAIVFSTGKLIEPAGSLGIDGEAFRQYLESGRKQPELENNMDMARVDGVRVLPGVIVDGKK